MLLFLKLKQTKLHDIEIYLLQNFGLDHNQFKKGMRDFKQCIEREPIVFNVEVKDPTAPVEFYINGELVDTSDGRIEQKDLGDGKHQLIINKVLKFVLLKT